MMSSNPGEAGSGRVSVWSPSAERRQATEDALERQQETAHNLPLPDQRGKMGEIAAQAVSSAMYLPSAPWW